MDKMQEQKEKMNNEGGGQKQGTAVPQQEAANDQLTGGQADTRHAQPPQGEERRHQQAEYDGEDRRKLEFRYA